jgi:hypothetical protein
VGRGGRCGDHRGPRGSGNVVITPQDMGATRAYLSIDCQPEAKEQRSDVAYTGAGESDIQMSPGEGCHTLTCRHVPVQSRCLHSADLTTTAAVVIHPAPNTASADGDGELHGATRCQHVSTALLGARFQQPSAPVSSFTAAKRTKHQPRQSKPANSRLEPRLLSLADYDGGVHRGPHTTIRHFRATPVTVPRDHA